MLEKKEISYKFPELFAKNIPVVIPIRVLPKSDFSKCKLSGLIPSGWNLITDIISSLSLEFEEVYLSPTF